MGNLKEVLSTPKQFIMTVTDNYVRCRNGGLSRFKLMSFLKDVLYKCVT